MTLLRSLLLCVMLLFARESAAEGLYGAWKVECSGPDSCVVTGTFNCTDRVESQVVIKDIDFNLSTPNSWVVTTKFKIFSW